MQARYQYGNLTLRKRKKGPDVWQFRWMENGKPKSVLIGTVKKYPTQADAERAVEYLRIKVNAQNPQPCFHSVTVGTLIDRFWEDRAPKFCRSATVDWYRSLLENHVRPKWGNLLLRDVKTVAVEDWLASYPHSRQIKRHARGVMHNLFQAARRWELIESNPIDLVRQSGTRLKTPRVLTPAQFKALLAELAEPYATMVITTACLGLRRCELIGLQWQDIDFENLTVKIQRSVNEGEVNETKNPASEATLPLNPDLAEALLAHRRRAAYVADSDYVFAGDTRKPRWPDSMLADHLKPAAVRAGIGKLGWHTFRHTNSTLLHALGTTPAVQKELLRHADIQTTLNIYTRAVSAEKREAASKVVRELWKA
jgi:integrase